MKQLKHALLIVFLILIASAIAQVPSGGALWTYYLVGNGWRWARLDVESPLQVDTSGTTAKLRVLLPSPPAIRETVERAVVSSSAIEPYVYTLANDPIPESLAVTVNGLVVELGFDYTLSGRTVTFQQQSLPGYPSAGSRLQFRYRY